MRFREWLLNEMGWINLREPIIVDFGEGEHQVDAIDPQIELWNRYFDVQSKLRMSFQIGPDRWLNVLGDPDDKLGPELRYMGRYEAEPEITSHPKYEPAPDKWHIAANMWYRNEPIGGKPAIPSVDWTPELWKKHVG